mgnify:CR=1 FL=1
MPAFNDGWLGVPSRPGKPRQNGLTHVMDKGRNLGGIAGNFLFSTGPNSQGGGKRNTRGHYDVPMRDCTVTLDNQVAQVQAHTEHKRSISGAVAVDLGHGLLKLDSSAQCIDCTGELDQSSIAGQLD